VENLRNYRHIKGICAAAAALLLSGAGSANAANILLQTNNAADGATTEDAPLVTFLTSLGHVVTTRAVNAGAVPTAAELAPIDLIIVSRNTTSGEYDDGTEPADWNALDKPLLLMAPHLARNTHWGFINGLLASPANEDRPSPALNPYTNPSHPFVAGAGNDVYPTGSRIDFVGATEIPSGATLVATATATLAAGGTQDLAAIVDIPQGTTMFNSKGVAGDRRVFFLMNDYPDQGGVQWGLTPAGQQILGQIITEMTVPEPGAAAALAGVGAFALFRRRRR
jgi:hypothetical protein